MGRGTYSYLDAYFNETTRRFIPECCHIDTRRSENPKSHKTIIDAYRFKIHFTIKQIIPFILW
jgi:hypothetical protein